MTCNRVGLLLTGLAISGLLNLSRCSPTASAADVTSTWSNAASGDWNVNTNWTNVPALGGFPNNGAGGVSTYDATISPVGSPYTVTLSTDITVEDLLLNSASATISQTSGTFTATGAINLSAGSFQLLGGTISNSVVNLTGGTLAIGLSNSNVLNNVTINGDLTLDTANTRVKLAGGTTFHTAHLAQTSTSLGFATGQTLTSTILFEGAATSTRGVEMNGTAGTFTVGPTGVIRTTAGFAGDAQIGPGFWFSGAMALTNQGLISSQTSGRTVTVSPDALTNSATGILEATGGGILAISPTSAWNNSGTIHVDNATVNLNGTFDATAGIGTWSNSGGTVNINGVINNAGNTLTLNNSTGSWNLTGGTINGGTLSFADGKTLAIGVSATNQLNGVTVNGDLTLDAANTRVKLAGGTTFNTVHLAQVSTSVGFAPGQTLNSTVLFEGAATSTRGVEMNGTAGTFTVGPTGVIRTTAGFAGDAQIGPPFWFSGAMTLTNQGLISSQTSGRTVTVSPDTLTNSATGILEATGGGILAISPTSAWNNSGTIHVNNATVNLNGTFDATAGIGTWSNTGGTVNINGVINNAGNTLTLNNSTGSWTLNGGTINGGSLSFADGKTLVIGVSATNLLNGVNVNGDLTLDAANTRVKLAGGTTFNTVHLAQVSTGVGFAPGQTLNSTVLFEGAATSARAIEMNGAAGAFTVGPTGVIRTAAGLGSDAQIGPAFWFGGAMALTNQGLISSQTSSRTVTVSPDTLTNSATGILEATGGGILTIGANNWSNVGTLRVQGGSTANLNGAWSNLGGTINVDATSTLNLSGSFSTANFGTLNLAPGSQVSITGAWDNSGQNFTLNAATGTWTLNGGTLNGGSLSFADGKTLAIGVSNSDVLNSVTVNGDLTLDTTNTRLKLAGGTTFNTAHLAQASTSLGFAPGQTLTSTILFEGAATSTRAVEMNGTAGTFTVGPTGVIRTAADFGGDAQIGPSFWFGGGTMSLVNQGLISSQVAGRTITVGPSSFAHSGTLEAINGGNLAVPQGYMQTAGVTRIGAGSTLSAVGQSGLSTITIAGGRLEGSGTMMANLVNSATIAPGTSAGVLTVTANTTLSSTSTLQIELGGTTGGTLYDQLHVTGQLSLGGALNVSVINNFNLAAGNSFDVLDWGAASGKFSSVLLPSLSGSLSWYTAQLYSNGRVGVIDSNFLPGDFNRDGHIDAADIPVMINALTDLNAYRTANGLTSAHLLAVGDVDLSGSVDNADLQSLLKLVQTGGGLLAVPEPSTAYLFIAGVAFAARRFHLRRFR